MPRTSSLWSTYGRLEDQWNQDFGKLQALKEQDQEISLEIANLSSEIEVLGKVLSIYHRLGESVQEHFLSSLESLVTAGIQAIFEESVSFHIRPKVRGNQVTMDFVLKNPDGSETDLIGSRGGGLISVIGVVLQIVTIRLMKDRIHQVLILDEPFSHLSAEYVEPCANFLRKLSDDFGCPDHYGDAPTRVFGDCGYCVSVFAKRWLGRGDGDYGITYVDFCSLCLLLLTMRMQRNLLGNT